MTLIVDKWKIKREIYKGCLGTLEYKNEFHFEDELKFIVLLLDLYSNATHPYLGFILEDYYIFWNFFNRRKFSIYWSLQKALHTIRLSGSCVFLNIPAMCKNQQVTEQKYLLVNQLWIMKPKQEFRHRFFPN